MEDGSLDEAKPVVCQVKEVQRIANWLFTETKKLRLVFQSFYG
jgi:hypothetical protein